MPIEIKELHVKINVQDDKKTSAAPKENSDAIVKECLEQVMLVIKNKNER